MKKVFAVILMVMSVVLANGQAQAEEHTVKAKPVYGQDVMKMLYTFNAPIAQIRDFGEISEAIALASSHDPIFPYIEEGAQLTAATLVAIAWHESRFQRSAIGDNGRSFGLYQIQPGVHKVDMRLLTLPRTASAVAIDLVRKSAKWCFEHKRPWKEMLAWYAASSDAGAKHPKVIHQSVVRMETMAKVYVAAFGEPALQQGVSKLRLSE